MYVCTYVRMYVCMYGMLVNRTLPMKYSEVVRSVCTLIRTHMHTNRDHTTIMRLHDTALHYSALHRGTLHYTTVHYAASAIPDNLIYIYIYMHICVGT